MPEKLFTTPDGPNELSKSILILYYATVKRNKATQSDETLHNKKGAGAWLCDTSETCKFCGARLWGVSEVPRKVLQCLKGMCFLWKEGGPVHETLFVWLLQESIIVSVVKRSIARCIKAFAARGKKSYDPCFDGVCFLLQLTKIYFFYEGPFPILDHLSKIKVTETSISQQASI